MESTVQRIQALAVGEELYFNMFQEGGALVERTELGYALYEIPLYGGEQQFAQDYAVDQVDELVAEALTWT